MKLKILVVLTFISFILPVQSLARQKLILLSTTSILDSGLLDVLIPSFEKRYHCQVKVIAVGTGQAIRLARDGNGDVLLVHDRPSEERFIAEGYGLKRLEVMHNEFVVVGPKNDPAGIGVENKRQKKDNKVFAAFKKIYQTKSFFVSRGDDSGTHKKELSIWKQLNLTPLGSWYFESGTGMEMTLRIANEKNAYCLVDKATWLAHKKEMDSLQILVKDAPILFNPYTVIVVSPKKFKWVNFKLALQFAKFLRGQEGQKIIKNYGREKFGQPLFSIK